MVVAKESKKVLAITTIPVFTTPAHVANYRAVPDMNECLPLDRSSKMREIAEVFLKLSSRSASPFFSDKLLY